MHVRPFTQVSRGEAWLSRGLLVGLLWLLMTFGGGAWAAEVPVIAAAADLNFALRDIAAAFEKETGSKVKLSFGSSGNFARQIAQGAPFVLFMSADEALVEQLASQNLTLDHGLRYATGRIVLFVPKGSTLTADADFADLRLALNDGRLKHFAIANPEHAPYGRAAAEALRHQQLWEAIEPKLILGENAAQAAQFATSGGVEGGIIPYALALAPAIASLGTYVLIPESWHAPLQQRMVLLKRAGFTARAFYDYLQGAAARDILKNYGFTPPAPTP